MKTIKKFTSIIVTLALFLSLFLTFDQVSEAAVSVSALKKAVPSKVRIMPFDEYTHGSAASTTAIFVPYASHENCIANIKVSKKSLKAKLTSETKRALDNSSYNEDAFPNYGIIGLYCEKTGTYKISFDVLTKKGGKKLYSKTVTVYVKNDYPIRSFKYAGKTNTWDLQTKAKGKVSVKMNKGYKLKSIEMGTYAYSKPENNSSSSEYSTYVEKRQTTELVYKKIKNNSTITLGTIPDYESTYRMSSYTYSDSNSYSYYRYLRDKILATTTIKITYIDKYTKKEAVATYSLTRFAK